MQIPVSDKSALIIQGPIYSQGNSGRGLGFQNPLVDEIKHNAVETINENIRKYENVFDLIIISTWEGENTKGIISSEKIKIIKNADQMQKREIHFGNNKYRQFYSVLKGLEVAKEYACSNIVKIRTDTQVDCGTLLELYKSRPERIWVVAHQKPNFLYDLFVVGNLQNLLDLTAAILMKRNLYIRIHEDLFYGYLYRRSNLWSKIKIWNFFPRDRFLTRAQAKLIKKAWEKDFSLIPQELWNQMIWRGYGIPSKFQISSESQFANFTDWLESQKNTKKNIIKFSIRNLLLFLVGPAVGAKINKKFQN
jgi:hypothetical protein